MKCETKIPLSVLVSHNNCVRHFAPLLVIRFQSVLSRIVMKTSDKNLPQILILQIKNKSSAVIDMGNHGHNRHGPKRGGCCAPFVGAAGSPSNTMWPGPRYTSVPSGILSIQPFGHNGHWGSKLGAVPLLGAELRPHLTQGRLRQGLPLYQVAS